MLVVYLKVYRFIKGVVKEPSPLDDDEAPEGKGDSDAPECAKPPDIVKRVDAEVFVATIAGIQ
jgi:hypothetical protein